MRTRRAWNSRRCIASVKFFVTTLFLFSVFVQTRQQQRDSKSKWDNRLLPTNSVYERNQELPPSSGNAASTLLSPRNDKSVVESGKTVENSSYENDEIYDEDYELEEPSVEEKDKGRDVTRSSEAQSPSDREAKTKNEESRIIDAKDSSVHFEDDAYYYYDDYDNITSPQNGASEHDAAEYFDSSEEIAVSSKPEFHNKTRVSGEDESMESVAVSMEENNSSLNSSTTMEVIKANEELQESNERSSNDPEEESLSEKLEEARDGQILIGEAVVSVVTTKSVVNGTFSVPASPEPMTTEQMVSPMIPSSTPDPGVTGEPSGTTEDPKIVASVQTSRSISGARFLPFLVVKTIDDNENDKDSEEPSTSSLSEETTESLVSLENIEKSEKVEEKTVTTKKSSLHSESTESIIDKLDRVQSELSSGFLASGFRTSGNNLQLDSLSEQRPTQPRKTFTTTSRTPIISKFVPRRYNQERKASSSASTISPKVTESLLNDENTASTEKTKFRWPSSSRNSRPSPVDSSSNKNSNNVRIFGSSLLGKSLVSPPTPVPSVQDISAFLPPGYKLKKEDDQVTEKSILSEILAKSKFDISSLLPANYKAPSEEKVPEKSEGEKNNSTTLKSIHKSTTTAEKVDNSSKTSSTTEKTLKPDKIQDLFSKSNVDISALLPPGYNRFKDLDKIEKSTTTSTEATKEVSPTSSTLATTAKPPGSIKLVFPSRPGGRKASTKATTTTHSSRIESGPVTPKIQKGWPTRATTEFTGWPTPSTTPISIEKLLEAARTATVASVNVSMITMTETSPTTSTSTTTTTTPRPTTPGICENECEVAGTIRIVGNATWVPELLDRNTQEWQQLAQEIEKEMNLVFLKSSVLRKWYKHIRIDAFSPGSILVDYFIELTDLTQRINTQELKVIFHDSLRTYNSDKWNETRTKGPIKLGAFSLDPKSTDFVVIPKVNYPQQIQEDDRLIPQWAIAVIVIGVGGLLFIIVFGVSVLVNRQNAAKLKPSPVVFTEEIAKSIKASHGAPSHRSSQDYPKSEISTIWNDTDLWRDKSFESNSNEVLVDGTLGRERNVEGRLGERKYNMYDSWRSEWNGYYYNPSQSSKFAGYESTTNLSRHPPDYDTNF